KVAQGGQGGASRPRDMMAVPPSAKVAAVGLTKGHQRKALRIYVFRKLFGKGDTEAAVPDPAFSRADRNFGNRAPFAHQQPMRPVGKEPAAPKCGGLEGAFLQSVQQTEKRSSSRRIDPATHCLQAASENP